MLDHQRVLSDDAQDIWGAANPVGVGAAAAAPLRRSGDSLLAPLYAERSHSDS